MSGFRSARAHLRGVTALYTGLLVHFSLHPYAGWRWPGPVVWDYWFSTLILPLHRSYPLDATFNVLAYIPLGGLALGSLPPAWRRLAWGGAIAWLACTLLSASLELTQAFLASRISSKVDLACNSLGAAIGVALARGLLGLPRPVRATLAAVANHPLQYADWEATLTLGIWLFGLLSPLRPPFVMGPWLGEIASWSLNFGVSQLVKGIATLSCLAGALLLGLSQLQPNSRRLPTFIPFLLIAGLGGWLLPQIQAPWYGLPLLSPVKLWGESGVAAVAAAMILSACAARSDWPCHRMAQLSLVALCVTIACTVALPRDGCIGAQPYPPPTQRIVVYLTSASEQLGGVWSAIAALAAWRLTQKASCEK